MGRLRSCAGIVLAFGIAAPAALALPTLTGTVEDRSGPVDGAKVALWLYETGKGLVVQTVSGRFAITPMKEGNYLFRVEKDGQTPVYGAVRLFGDGEHSIKIYLRPKDPGEEIGEDTPPEKETPAAESKPHADEKAVAAKRTKVVQPRYPEEDKARRIQGDVVMTAVIAKDGAVDDLVVLASPDLPLALASLAAAREWKYRPTELDGKPVDVITEIKVHFRLD